MSESDSVSLIIQEVKDGDERAINNIWDRFFPVLVHQAGRKLCEKGVRIADGEDVAISVFESFFRAAKNGRFPDLHDEQGLWRLLSTMTRRKVVDWIRKQSVRPTVAGSHPVDQLQSPNASPAFELVFGEEIERLVNLLPEKYQPVARKKLECCSNREIADALGISIPTVERYVHNIRRIWAKERDD